MPREEDETLDDEHEDENDDDGEEDEEDPPKRKKSGEEVVLTQRRLQSMMTREKDEGRRAGRRSLLKDVGVEDADELKEIVKAYKAHEDKNSSEADKAKRDADKAKREADEAKAEAAKLRQGVKVERALMQANVPAKQVDKVARMLDIADEADDDEINDAVEDLKADFPHLFTVSTDDEDEGDEEDDSPDGSSRRRSDGPPRSDPGQPKRKRRPSKSTRDQAKSLLHERHPNLVKQS